MTRKPAVKSGVRVREESFGALVFTNRTPILSLNSDSYLIWKEISGSRSVKDICDSLRNKFGSDENLVETVNRFLAACEDLDLIEFR